MTQSECFKALGLLIEGQGDCTEMETASSHGPRAFTTVRPVNQRRTDRSELHAHTTSGEEGLNLLSRVSSGPPASRSW